MQNLGSIEAAVKIVESRHPIGRINIPFHKACRKEWRLQKQKCQDDKRKSRKAFHFSPPTKNGHETCSYP